MHDDRSAPQEHESSQVGKRSYCWWLYVLIVINSTLGISCMALIMLGIVYDARGDLSYEASVGLILLTVFVFVPIVLLVLAPAAMALLAVTIAKWSDLGWKDRMIAASALILGGMPPVVIFLFFKFADNS